MPRVSVVIPSYNCASLVSGAIDSVLSQTFQDFEIIIIDDGSSDGTREIADGYTAKHPGKIKYFYQNNAGHSSARNRGIRESCGEFIAFLDADDIWRADKLDKQMAIFEEFPQVDAVFSNVAVFFDKVDELIFPLSFVHIDGGFYPPGKLFWKILYFETDVRIQTLVGRRGVFERVGYFDEKMSQWGSEDREFFLRLFRACASYYIDESLVYYHDRPDSASKNQDKMKKGRAYLIDKIVSESPDKNKREMKDRILSRLHLRLGKEFAYSRNFTAALSNLSMALFQDIFNSGLYRFIFQDLFWRKFCLSRKTR